MYTEPFIVHGRLRELIDKYSGTATLDVKVVKGNTFIYHYINCMVMKAYCWNWKETTSLSRISVDQPLRW